MMGAEVRGTNLQGHQEWPAAIGSWERGGGQSLPRTLRKEPPILTPCSPPSCLQDCEGLAARVPTLLEELPHPSVPPAPSTALQKRGTQRRLEDE